MGKISLGIQDSNTESYSRLYHFWKKRVVISKLFAGQLKHSKEPIKILDVGCGKGTDLFYINSIYGKSNRLVFIGVDISIEDIKFCSEAKNKRKISNFAFLATDSRKLTFKDETFDMVICSEVLEHLSNPIEAILEIKRVLKARGAAIITTPNKSNSFLKIAKIFRLFGFWKNKVDKLLPETLQDSKEGFRHISVKSLSEWIDIFRKAEFKIESIKRGSPIFGGINYDSHNLLFAILLIADVILDYLPFTKNFTETVIMKLRKR